MICAIGDALHEAAKPPRFLSTYHKDVIVRAVSGMPETMLCSLIVHLHLNRLRASVRPPHPAAPAAGVTGNGVKACRQRVRNASNDSAKSPFTSKGGA